MKSKVEKKLCDFMIRCMERMKMTCSIHGEDESQIKARGSARSYLVYKFDKKLMYGRGYILATKRDYKGWGGMRQE